MNSDIVRLTSNTSSQKSGNSLPSLPRKDSIQLQTQLAEGHVATAGKLPGHVINEADLRRNDLEKILLNFNSSDQAIQRGLQFSLDDASGRYVVKVINKKTDEIIKQFPPEEILSLSRKIQNYVESENKPDAASGLLLETEG